MPPFSNLISESLFSISLIPRLPDLFILQHHPQGTIHGGKTQVVH